MIKTKKKLIIIIAIGVILSIGIYRITINNKYNLLSLGDSLASGMTIYNVNGYSYTDYLKDYLKDNNELNDYNNIFVEPGMTISELQTKINNNYIKTYNGKEITIQQALKSSNLIIIGIGIDELNELAAKNALTQKNINIYLKNMENLLKLIKKYNNKKVIVLGVYNTYYLTNANDINSKIEKLSNKYSYDFVDISKVINNDIYFFENSSYYLNYKGHKEISRLLKKLL